MRIYCNVSILCSLEFIFSLFLCTKVFSKEIALTFDDAPRGDEGVYTGIERTDAIIKQLKKSGVTQAAFFCNTRDLDETGRSRLQAYANAGHIIANHTHSHLDLHQTDISAYVDDIKKSHDLLNGFSTFRLWFRFPFLREGDSTQKRDGIKKALARMKYANAYVTVDNYDWYLNQLVQGAIRAGKRVNFQRLRKIYVKVLMEGVEFYDSIAKRTLHRSPKHVLLLHENDLAALYLADLVKELQSRRWSVVSVEDAYTDPIAKVEPDTLFLGQGRVAAIAFTKGDLGPFRKWESESELEKLFEAEKVFE